VQVGALYDANQQTARLAAACRAEALRYKAEAEELRARVVALEAQARADEADIRRFKAASGAALPPPPRTKWTRRVLLPVLIGHAASLTPYRPRPEPRSTP
jgi:hypothetical protein